MSQLWLRMLCQLSPLRPRRWEAASTSTPASGAPVPHTAAAAAAAAYGQLCMGTDSPLRLVKPPARLSKRPLLCLPAAGTTSF